MEVIGRLTASASGSGMCGVETGNRGQRRDNKMVKIKTTKKNILPLNFARLPDEHELCQIGWDWTCWLAGWLLLRSDRSLVVSAECI